MNEQETCQKTVNAGLWPQARPCGKPAKADGLCGVHLAAKRRIADNDAKRHAEWAAEDAARITAQEQIAALAELGWAAHAGRRPGDVVIEDVQRLIETLSGDES